MRRIWRERWIFLAALMALALCVHNAGAESLSKESAAFGARDRTYYLYVPDDAPAPHPLIVLLHGSGGNGLFMVQRWKEIAAREHLILLGPDSLDTDAGWNPRTDGPDYIHALVTGVAQKYPIDMRRIYLFGQSGGAVYSMFLGMLESEYFAAVAFHGGSLREAREYKLLDYAKRKIPILITDGDQDEYFPLRTIKDTERRFVDGGFPVELDLMEGRKHSYLDVPDDYHDTVWAFLKRHPLDDAPRYATYTTGAN